MVRYGDPGAIDWIESGGGPLIVIPEESLSAWRGADGEDWKDYDRACAVDGHVGLIAVGQSHALVLGFDPASTAFLPNPGAFVRWIAADSEEELLDSVEGALASVVWEETVTWDVPGPVVLLDSACPGGGVHEDERLRVEMAAGRYRVQAAEVTPAPRTTLCLVQFVPVT
ncbi:Imm21 family immunity protein [Streptomyces olivochromogenes]|uniref:Immunity protein 21 of polymorphic toxin system n=1 Tax=Streptomyces olivochromogenes TaxID=1963 RepID=A0A250VIS6_STROL|nr:Imm21 family immunity protein [Streptomyces olivochromogenes]KUN43288.1 hypothetical protein AQJ27_32495 [Streptomyces olivochromogenes]GAX53986.1 hypothetical protein SO3561_05518 [Streptomyces olivochromogenes]